MGSSETIEKTAAVSYRPGRRRDRLEGMLRCRGWVILGITVMTWSCAVPVVHSSPPRQAPARLLQNTNLDLGGAVPNSDRGPEQPLWPGAAAPLVAQVIEEPPDPIPLPPESARQSCNSWYIKWLDQRTAEHGSGPVSGTNPEDSGWFDEELSLTALPAPHDHGAWRAWIAQETDRCVAAITAASGK